MRLAAPRVGRQGAPRKCSPLILSLPGSITFRAVPRLSSGHPCADLSLSYVRYVMRLKCGSVSRDQVPVWSLSRGLEVEA